MKEGNREVTIKDDSHASQQPNLNDLADVPCAGECSVTTTIGLIGGKWKILILWQLRNKTRRTGELQRLLPGVTKKMLTQQIRELESDGLVNRKVYPEVPPKVEYSLTETGKSIQSVIDTICDWGDGYRKRRDMKEL